MKSFLKAAVAASALFAATPAAAAIVVYNGVEYGVGETITVDFTGTDSDGNDGLAGQLMLTLQDPTAGSDYVFAYSIANTATDPDQADSRLTGFGFNVDPDIDGATEDGPLTVHSGNISNSTILEFCLTSNPNGNNCAGGGGDGDAVGGGAIEGFFTLLYDGDDPTIITLTGLTTRFQSTGPDGEGSGIGTPNNSVPEPGTWAMMLLGFGVIGGAMRRQRRAAHLLQMA
jgi:hypothetical protein